MSFNEFQMHLDTWHAIKWQIEWA